MRSKNIKSKSKYKLYLNAYINTLEEYVEKYSMEPNQDLKPLLKKIIVYGVKLVNTEPKTEYIERDQAEKDFRFVSNLKEIMGLLTPKEFVQIFPIAKEYNGSKYNMKDYFYTRDYIKSLEQDKPIGEEILNFMWEYHNWELTDFNIEIMERINRLRRLEGEPSLMKEFADEIGLKTYTLHKDGKGKEFMIDSETGKTIKVSRKPRYLKVVK